ncbi:MAG TPA: hypothetical protein VHX44_05230 [Planctomycetota bacterium]|nr:hypothetical protein [Planctomycetota bacterium]
MIRALVLVGVIASLFAGEEPAPATIPAPAPTPIVAPTVTPTAPTTASPVPVAVTPVAEAPALAPVPPSPSTAPGIRIWPDPRFSHWPPVVYRDEPRNVAFALPVKKPGAAGTIGWDETPVPMPFTLPSDAESISGLLPLPEKLGNHRATVVIESGSFPIDLRIVDARERWPIVRLDKGFPVDAEGHPVVLQDRRRGTREERVWSLLDSGGTRPDGRAVLVGDPLEALGSRVWDNLDADPRPTSDERYPHHAVLVTLATILGEPGKDLKPWPRTIVWCPGNQTLLGGAWSAEEERVLGAVRTRCERLGIAPRLVLALPSWPVEAHLQARATERRDLLLRSANRLGWVVVDLARAAGSPEDANRVAPQVFTTYPLAPAQERMRTALRDALAR